MAKSHDEIWDEWGELVNMAPAALEDWLETEDSRRVGDTGGDTDGDTGGGAESTGHESGRRIVEIKRTKKDDLTDGQWDHMGKTVGYIKRHLAQGGPDEDMENSDWRYSLMNWGHDPAQ